MSCISCASTSTASSESAIITILSGSSAGVAALTACTTPGTTLDLLIIGGAGACSAAALGWRLRAGALASLACRLSPGAVVGTAAAAAADDNCCCVFERDECSAKRPRLCSPAT